MRMGPRAVLLAAVAASVCTASAAPSDGTQASTAPDRFALISERVDPWVEKPRVIVMTDIANEPDDQMSMVRLLVYSNELEVEGLVATTSTWMRRRVRRT